MANWRSTVYIAPDALATDTSYGWQDYTRFLRDDSPTKTARGRQDETQHHNNGTLTCLLDNREQTFTRTVNGWVQCDRPVQFLLEYPWLPGRISNGGFEAGWTGWGVEAGAPVTSVVTNLDYAADAGGRFFSGRFAHNEGIISAPSNVKGGQNQNFGLSLRGITRSPGVQIQIHIRWYDDVACTSLSADQWIDCPVDYFYDPEVPVGDVYSDIYSDIYPGGYSVFKWKRYGAVVFPAGGAVANGVRVAITNLAGPTSTVAFDSVVLDFASFQGVFPQYTGYADGWKRTWDVGDALCALTSDDGFKQLGKTKLRSQSYSSFVLTGSNITHKPTHFYRLSEPGKNNTNVHFRDSVSGDARAVSAISGPRAGIIPADPQGVGPLYNVAGLVATDNDGAFSCLGPSSQDHGYITLPSDFGVAGTEEFAIAFMWRSVNGAIGEVPFWFAQGASTDDNHLRFYLSDFDPQLATVLIKDRAGIYSFLYHSDDLRNHGINIFDQAPHFFVCHRMPSGGFQIWVDGIKVADTGTSGVQSLIPNTPVVGWSMDTRHFPADQEFGMFMLWKGSGPTDADVAALYQRSIRLWPEEKSGDRIAHILDTALWPSTLRNLDSGDSFVEQQAAPLVDQNAHTYNQQVEDSEQGWMFIAKDGRFRWRSRQSFFKSRTSLVTLGTGPGELPYADVDVSDDDTLVYNQGITARTNGAPQHIADNESSQKQHFISSLERTALMLVSEAETQAAAETIVDKYSVQKTKLNQVVLEGIAGDAVMAQIILREIGDRITVRTREPGQVGYTEYIALIQGIALDASRGKLTCTWDVSTLYVRDYFLFGDTFGSRPMGW